MGKSTNPTLKPKTLKVKVSTDVVEGERTILAVVTSSSLDRDYEYVDVPSLRLPLKGGGVVRAKDLTGAERLDIPLLLNHSFDVEDTIGSARSAYLNEVGELVVLFGISKRAKAQDLMLLIDEQHLDNAFSITMGDYQYLTDTIYDAEIAEISLVFRGSNKDARVLAVKSLMKGTPMAEATLEEKKAEIERLSKEVAEAEKPEVVTPAAETPGEATPATPAEEEEENPAPAPNAEKSTNPKKVKTMSKEVAIKQVKDPVPTPEVPERSKSTLSKNQQRELFVKQFVAFKAGDRATLQQLNEKAYEADTSEDRDLKKKAIGYSEGASIFQTEVVSADILDEYTNVGRVGQLVRRIDITGAETWKQIIQTAGNGFRPVGVEEEKQEDKPVWSHLSVTPKEHALIVAWYDAMAKRTPLAVYQSLISYIAKEYAKLEDKIILSFAGVTTNGGDEFAATGLVPLLLAAGNRTVNVATFSAADVQAGLGRAYGHIDSDDQLTLVCSRQTWGMLAVTVDSQGRNVFTVVGDQVSAGALGTFNVRISQEVPNGVVVMGAYSDYELVTIGGLETLFSREATVGDLNLFTSDASALRANADIAGKPVRLSSFVLIDFVPQVS